MKKIICGIVSILWAMPMIVAMLMSIYVFAMCFTYWYLVFVLPSSCIITVKMMSSYETDVEETMELIRKIRKDICD